MVLPLDEIRKLVKGETKNVITDAAGAAWGSITKGAGDVANSVTKVMSGVGSGAADVLKKYALPVVGIVAILAIAAKK